MKTLYVIVTSASSSMWYNTKIKEKFEVTEPLYQDQAFRFYYDVVGTNKVIFKSDCIVVD